MAINIFRPQTTEEKRNFQNVMNLERNKEFEFRKRVEAIESEFLHEKKIPFCSRCARIDWKDKRKRIIEELERNEGYVENFNELNVETTDEEIRSYGDTDKFIEGKKQEMKEMKMIDGSKIMATTGSYMNYKCKKRNCGISVWHPVKGA